MPVKNIRGDRRIRGSAIGSMIRVRDGFTLVEALIGLIVSMLVLTAALTVVNTQREASRTTRLTSELRQNARYALDMITRDLLEAGQGMDPNTVFGVVAASNNDSTTSDTLYTMSADPGTQVHLVRTPLPGEDSTVIQVKITCADSVTDISTGNFVYLASGTARGVARVNTVTRNQNSNTCGGDPDLDLGTVRLGISIVDGGGHCWSYAGNENAAAVQRVNAAVYFIDTSDTIAGPTLSRTTEWNNGWQSVPIAYGITHLQVQLGFADGNLREAANGADSNVENDHDDVNTVHVRLKAQARRTDKDLKGGNLLEQEFSVSVSPRNQLYTRNRN